MTIVRLPPASQPFQSYCGWSSGMWANHGSDQVAQELAVSLNNEAQSIVRPTSQPNCCSWLTSLPVYAQASLVSPVTAADAGRAERNDSGTTSVRTRSRTRAARLRAERDMCCLS